jgi:hypothetical protein
VWLVLSLHDFDSFVDFLFDESVIINGPLVSVEMLACMITRLQSMYFVSLGFEAIMASGCDVYAPPVHASAEYFYILRIKRTHTTSPSRASNTVCVRTR